MKQIYILSKLENAKYKAPTYIQKTNQGILLFH